MTGGLLPLLPLLLVASQLPPIALARVPSPDSVFVRGLTRDTTLAIVPTLAGGALRADAVLPLVGGAARAAGTGRWTIELPGATLGLVDGAPFVAHRDGALPLASAPELRDGALLLPLQFLADVVPRVANNIYWDAEHRELRALRLVVRRTPPPSARPVVPAATASVRPVAPSRAAADPAPAAPRPARRRIVVVDAGHGGPDAGMRGPIGGRTSIAEKDITLAVARRLERALEARDVDVVMTRTTDTLIALADRGRIANQRKGDLFISIHVNAANMRWRDPAGARGFETYFLAEAKTEDERRVAEMENEVVRFETGAPAGDALGFILSDMRQNEHLRESNDLAETIQARLAGIHPGPSRGVKQAGFVVLVTAFMPSVLVEIGFGTSPDEAAYLASAAGQRAIADAVADAAIAYLAHYERRVGSGAPGARE